MRRFATAWLGLVWLLCALLIAATGCEDPSPEPYFLQLKSRDREERLIAASRLLRFGDEIVPRLLVETGSEYLRVRFEVVKLLGRLRSPQGVPALMESLGDRSANVAQAAAWALGEIGDPVAVSALLAYTGDPSKGMRKQVIRSIGACYSDSLATGVADSAYAEVSRALRDTTAKISIAALEAIRFFGYRGAADQVIRMSRDTSPEVRHVAVQCLGQIGAGVAPRSPGPATARARDNIVEALVAALDDSFQSIRTKSVRSLDMTRATTAIPDLEALARRGTDEDRREARGVLEKLRAQSEEKAE